MTFKTGSYRTVDGFLIRLGRADIYVRRVRYFLESNSDSAHLVVQVRKPAPTKNVGFHGSRSTQPTRFVDLFGRGKFFSHPNQELV